MGFARDYPRYAGGRRGSLPRVCGRASRRGRRGRASRRRRIRRRVSHRGAAGRSGVRGRLTFWHGSCICKIHASVPEMTALS